MLLIHYSYIIYILYIPVLIIVHTVCVLECICMFRESVCYIVSLQALSTAANLQSWRKQLQCRYISKGFVGVDLS